MAEEFDGDDANAWKEEGLTFEEQINYTLNELDEFNAIREPHKDSLEVMLYNITKWREKFAKYNIPGLKDVLDKALLKTEVKIAIAYLNIFKYIENPPEDTCRLVYKLVRILNLPKSAEFIYKTSDPETHKKEQQSLMEKIDEVLMTITSTYPEILEE
ncbi:MAG: hypothetical protein WCF92_03265 [bacterium]